MPACCSSWFNRSRRLGIRQQGNICQVGLYLPAALTRFSINTVLRQAHFLADVCEEGWGLSDLKEEASGEEYEGRKKLGNTRLGDWVRYKGHGPVQLTGRANYARAGRELDLDLVGNPGLAESASVAVDTACLYPRRSRAGSTVSACSGVKEHTAYLVKAKALLGVGAVKGGVMAPTRTAPDGSPIYTV